MTSPISRIGGQKAVTRDAGSDGHEAVAKQLDGDPRAKTMPRNKKVEEVAKMYERQFLGEMFKAMRSTVSETDKPSMAQNIYNSQRDDQYIDAWSEQGGVGFSNIIYDQMMERFFGQTQQGHALKKQGMIPITDREITKVSQVKNGVATPIIPESKSVKAALSAAEAVTVPSAVSVSPAVRRTVENTEPMPAPTPRPAADNRTTEERVAAGELFPTTATVAATQTKNGTDPASATVPAPVVTSQTALQIEVRPSPTGAPAKIQAPWDAVILHSTKMDGSRTAVLLEHGKGLRSTLVFDGVLSAAAQPGQKIPRGEAIGTLNADAKSFLWNLAPQVASAAPEEQTAGQD
jgi:Rod binding domain-containing protein